MYLSGEKFILTSSVEAPRKIILYLFVQLISSLRNVTKRKAVVFVYSKTSIFERVLYLKHLVYYSKFS